MNLARQPFFRAAHAGRNSFWLVLVTILIVIGLNLSGSVCLVLPLIVIGQFTGSSPLNGPLLTAVTLLTFGFVLFGLYLGVRVLHQRPFHSIVYPAGPFRWKLALLSAGLWFGLNALSDGLMALLQPGNYQWRFDAGTFWLFLPVMLLLLPVQVSAEELFFRGYLTQMLGLKARTIWLPWLLPAAIFGLLHAFNPEVGLYGVALTLPIYVGLGVLLGWLVVRTQGLEMSLGLHLANNLYAALIVSMPGSVLSTPTLFAIQKYNPLVGLIALPVMAVLFLALAGLLTKQPFWKMEDHLSFLQDDRLEGSNQGK